MGLEGPAREITVEPQKMPTPEPAEAPPAPVEPVKEPVPA